MNEECARSTVELLLRHLLGQGGHRPIDVALADARVDEHAHTHDCNATDNGQNEVARRALAHGSRRGIRFAGAYDPCRLGLDRLGTDNDGVGPVVVDEFRLDRRFHTVHLGIRQREVLIDRQRVVALVNGHRKQQVVRSETVGDGRGVRPVDRVAGARERVDIDDEQLDARALVQRVERVLHSRLVPAEGTHGVEHVSTIEVDRILCMGDAGRSQREHSGEKHRTGAES